MVVTHQRDHHALPKIGSGLGLEDNRDSLIFEFDQLRWYCQFFEQERLSLLMCLRPGVEVARESRSTQRLVRASTCNGCWLLSLTWMNRLGEDARSQSCGTLIRNAPGAMPLKLTMRPSEAPTRAGAPLREQVKDA